MCLISNTHPDSTDPPLDPWVPESHLTHSLKPETLGLTSHRDQGLIDRDTGILDRASPDGVELDGVLLGLTHHLGDHGEVRHLRRRPAELEHDGEQREVRERRRSRGRRRRRW